jgi:hypothetical protein
MTSSCSPGITPNPGLARLLAALSIVLLVVFLAAVLSTALPPKLLDPQGQLPLAAALINSASLALMGSLLLPRLPPERAGPDWLSPVWDWLLP